MKTDIPTPPCSPPAAAPTAAVALQPPAMPALPVKTMPLPVRAAVALQSVSPVTPAPVTAAASDAILAHLPPAIAGLADHDCNEAADAAPVCEDRRQWLTSHPVIQNRTGSRRASISFGTPPAGLTVVERFLWPELGCACARAVNWLHTWLLCKKYLVACESSGLQSHEITAMRSASPRFMAAYGAIEAAVRTTRHARNEDTLDALANGEAKRTKQALTLEGKVVTLTETLPPDVKALQLALAREDPAYRQAGAPVAGGGGVAINITFSGVRRFLGKPSDGGDIVDAEVIQPAASDD